VDLKSTQPALSGWIGAWVAAAVLPGWYVGAGLAEWDGLWLRLPVLSSAIAATLGLWLTAVMREWVDGRRVGGAGCRRRRVSHGLALHGLLIWFALGLMAGLRSIPSTGSGDRRARAHFPAVRQATYFMVRVETVNANPQPPEWSGSLVAWLDQGAWSALKDPLPVRGRWSDPERGSFLFLGSASNDWVALERSRRLRARDSPRLYVTRAFRFGDEPRGGPAPSLSARVAGARQRFSQRVIKVLGQDTGTLAAWTFLGPQQAAPRSWADPFRQTGTLHLLAISGFHMTLLAGLFWLILRVATGGARWCRWPALGILALYSFAVGAPAPAMRAFGGTLVLAFAPSWGRGARVWDALGWTAAILVILQPELARGASFPLCVGATVGVFLGGDLSTRSWRKLEGWVLGSGGSRGGMRRSGTAKLRRLLMPVQGSYLLLGASAGASLLTTPWCLHHFNVVYPRGVLVNLLAVPAMGMVMVCQLVSIGAIAFGAGSTHPLVAIGRGTGEGLLGLIRLAAGWSSKVPVFGNLTSGETLAVSLACGAGMWTLARWMSRRWRTRNENGDEGASTAEGCEGRAPVAVRRRGRRSASGYDRELALCLGLLLLPVAEGAWLHAREEAGFRRAPLEVRFLDVGQGDAILVRTGSHHWLVDLGIGSMLGRDKLVPQLCSARIRRLERVWITHGDSDHWGGLADLLASPVRVDTLVLPQSAPFPDEFWQILAGSSKRPVLVRAVAPWVRGVDGMVRVHLLHPFPGPPPPHNNDNSFVLLFETPPEGGCREPFRLLLVGDLEQSQEGEVLASGLLPRVTMAQLGHHGSRTAGSPAWWSRTRPLAAVASIGMGNRFGFPHRETLEKVAAWHAVFLRTDQDGAIRIGAGGEKLLTRRGR
jgi:competence protein ComEC